MFSRRPSEPSIFARFFVEKALRPLERFLRVEASSGVVLIVAAAAALIWANSSAAASYERLWHTSIPLGAGRFFVEKSLHFLVNDALMTIFFFVAGLEIRRELQEGELSDRKRASLPAAAALGGMIAPALIFTAWSTPETRRGFGVPTATDIAFAVGVLALLGKRVPPALRVLLLSLAIIDDVGAILLIAVFYSSGVAWAGLAIAAGGVIGVLAFQRLGVRRAWAYVLPGAIVWLGMLYAGIHPTIAGVVLGLLTPARAWSLKSALHSWVAFGIMPLFALANAGVSLKGMTLDAGPARTIAGGVLVGLTVGKPLGVLLVSFLCVKVGLCALPRGVRWRDVLVVGLVAGIGFTMAIFIAGLAFAEPEHLAAAKLGVLSASVVAGAFGLAAGRVLWN